MKFALLIAASAIALSACVMPDPLADVETGTPTKLTAAQVSAVKTGVKNALKDPDSARFGNTMSAARLASGSIIVCGYVNARNSMGGYTGEKPFQGLYVTETKRFAVTGMGGTDSATYAVTAVCSRSGAPV